MVGDVVPNVRCAPPGAGPEWPTGPPGATDRPAGAHGRTTVYEGRETCRRFLEDGGCARALLVLRAKAPGFVRGTVLGPARIFRPGSDLRTEARTDGRQGHHGGTRHSRHGVTSCLERCCESVRGDAGQPCTAQHGAGRSGMGPYRVTWRNVRHAQRPHGVLQAASPRVACSSEALQ
jgi:hypothetical protein